MGWNKWWYTGAYSPNHCDYSDAYILFKENIVVNNTAAEGPATNNTNKKVIFKNYPPFTKCIYRINNTQIDDAE